MSRYIPDPKTLYIAKQPSGWFVMDKYGPLDGPYQTAGDAKAVLATEAKPVWPCPPQSTSRS